MSEAPSARNAKKNAKRKAARQRKQAGGGAESSGGGLDPDQMIEILKKELDKAKAEKRHADTSKLRDQIWVLTDMARGVRTNIPDDELDPILESIEEYMRQQMLEKLTAAQSNPSTNTSATGPKGDRPSNPKPSSTAKPSDTKPKGASAQKPTGSSDKKPDGSSAAQKTSSSSSKKKPTESAAQKKAAEPKASPPAPTSDLTPEQRKVRNLKKKLNQINALKEKQANGEELKEDQLEKVALAQQVQKDIQVLEKMIKKQDLSGH